MKILQVLLHSGTGGAETVADILTSAWEDDGHSVRTCALTDATSGPEARQEGWKAPVFRFKRVFAAVAHFKPDLIVAHTTIAGLYTRAAAPWAGYRHRTVVVAHSASDDYSNAGLLIAEVALSAVAPAIWLCVSQTGRGWLVRRPIRGRSTARVVHNPVAERFRRVERSPDSGELLMLGRVAPQKDLLTAVNAVRLARDSGCDVRLTVAGALGDAGYVTAVRSRISELEMQAHVTLLGVHPDVTVLLGTAQALLHTAVSEAASQSLREAFVAGVPILSSDAAAEGVPEVSPYAIFPVGEPEAAAARIVDLLHVGHPPSSKADPELYRAEHIARLYIDHWRSHEQVSVK